MTMSAFKFSFWLRGTYGTILDHHVLPTCFASHSWMTVIYRLYAALAMAFTLIGMTSTFGLTSIIAQRRFVALTDHWAFLLCPLDSFWNWPSILLRFMFCNGCNQRHWTWIGGSFALGCVEKTKRMESDLDECPLIGLETLFQCRLPPIKRRVTAIHFQ